MEKVLLWVLDVIDSLQLEGNDEKEDKITKTVRGTIYCGFMRFHAFIACTALIILSTTIWRIVQNRKKAEFNRKSYFLTFSIKNSQ